MKRWEFCFIGRITKVAKSLPEDVLKAIEDERKAKGERRWE
jgi:hypothetical protein